ncbi:MAG: CYTH domain-containing protein [Beijerinckiaceae bacterium]|nr:CYTH domain-containing protein [Beijerinckiaceae bacterium]
MAMEIERKFLVDMTAWTPDKSGVAYRQGYICSDNERVVRVRIAGDRAFLTIKGTTENISRLEFEYPVPLADAATLLDRLCETPLIEKTRYTRQIGGKIWEIDIFHGDNAGLVVAEIELTAEDETFERPAWAGEEVSGDARYYNSNLMKYPFKAWRNGSTKNE